MSPRRLDPFALSLTRTLVGFMGLMAVALYVVLFTLRVRYPLELVNIEGMMMDHIVRLVRGEPLYVAPSASFVPLAYMPLYPALVAVLAKVFGISLTLGRLVSGLGALGVAGIAYVAVRRSTGSVEYGLAGAGLYLMGQGAARGMYDVVRPDSLMLLLAFGGLMTLWLGRGIRSALAGGLILALAFFTKQHALLFGAAALGWLITTDRRRAAPYALAWLGGILGGYLSLTITMGPWFDFYVRDVPSHWSTVSGVRLLDYLRYTLLGRCAMATLAMAVSFAMAERPWRGPDAVWWWAALGAIGTGLLATLDPYAFYHVLMPTFAGLAIAGPIALHRVGERFAGLGAPVRARIVTDIVAVLAFVAFIYPVHELFPRRHARAARMAFELRLRDIPGRVLVVSHGGYAVAAGHEMGMTVLPLDDVVRARGNDLLRRDPEAIERVFDTLRHGPDRPTLVTDGPLERVGDLPRPLWASLAPHYRLADSLDTDLTETLRPVTGNLDAPRYIYVPRQEVP